MSGVENRRSSGSLPVAFVSAAFAERASIRFGMALFPVLAHRTGQAHLAHPALGESFTISPTEGCLLMPAKLRFGSARLVILRRDPASGLLRKNSINRAARRKRSAGAVSRRTTLHAVHGIIPAFVSSI